MTPLDQTGPLLAALIGLLVWLVVLVGLYLWYAFALSRLFPRLGGEAWKGWVPILNDMEVLVRGGVPGYSIVFAFIPFVNFYYIYLRIVAVHRIGTRLGRGAGMTVLGMLVPPLWATLLARATTVVGTPLEQRVVGYAPSASGVPLVAPSGVPGTSGVPVVAPGGAHAASGGVGMPHPAGVVPPVPAASQALAAPAAPQPVAPQPVASQPAIAPAAVAPAPATAPLVPPVPAAPASIAPAPISAPPAATPAPTLGSALDDDDAFAETVVVQRRPRIRYRLDVEGGPSIPLSSDTVVLGRRPVTGEPGTQDVAVPDTTRTLSKVHARLHRTDDGWIITDLASTNGVVVVDDAGNETLLDRGASALVRSRFILGTVALSLVEESGRA